jgi:hypothetical protein
MGQDQDDVETDDNNETPIPMRQEDVETKDIYKTPILMRQGDGDDDDDNCMEEALQAEIIHPLC